MPSITARQQAELTNPSPPPTHTNHIITSNLKNQLANALQSFDGSHYRSGSWAISHPRGTASIQAPPLSAASTSEDLCDRAAAVAMAEVLGWLGQHLFQQPRTAVAYTTEPLKLVSTRPVGSRTDGSWRHLAACLLQQVDFVGGVQTQLLPKGGGGDGGDGGGGGGGGGSDSQAPRLLSNKVITLINELWRQRQAAASRDSWSGIVFVERRLVCLLLTHLVNSLDAMRARGLAEGGVRARAFLGHNQQGGAQENVMSVSVSGCMWHFWVGWGIGGRCWGVGGVGWGGTGWGDYACLRA